MIVVVYLYGENWICFFHNLSGIFFSLVLNIAVVIFNLILESHSSDKPSYLPSNSSDNYQQRDV